MLKQLENGDIIECFVYNKGTEDWFLFLDGVFNKEDETLVLTTSDSKFDFNNHNLYDVEFKFNIIGNINNCYKYSNKEVSFKDIFDYLAIDKELDDISFKIYSDSNGDIGYFEEYPVNIVEIRNGLISKIAFNRGRGKNGLNQDLLNWLYYLKDMKVKIRIN